MAKQRFVNQKGGHFNKADLPTTSQSAFGLITYETHSNFLIFKEKPPVCTSYAQDFHVHLWLNASCLQGETTGFSGQKNHAVLSKKEKRRYTVPGVLEKINIEQNSMNLDLLKNPRKNKK